MLRAAICLGVPLLAVLLQCGVVQQFAAAVRVPGGLYALAQPSSAAGFDASKAPNGGSAFPQQLQDCDSNPCYSRHDSSMGSVDEQGRHLLQWASNSPNLKLSDLGVSSSGRGRGRRLEEVHNPHPGPLYNPATRKTVLVAQHAESSGHTEGAHVLEAGAVAAQKQPMDSWGAGTWGDMQGAQHGSSVGSSNVIAMLNGVLDSFLAVVTRATSRMELKWPLLPSGPNSSTKGAVASSQLAAAVGAAAAAAEAHATSGDHQASDTAHSTPPLSLSTGRAAEAGMALLQPLHNTADPVACADASWLKAEIPAAAAILLPPCKQRTASQQAAAASHGDAPAQPGVLLPVLRKWWSAMVSAVRPASSITNPNGAPSAPAAPLSGPHAPAESASELQQSQHQQPPAAPTPSTTPHHHLVLPQAPVTPGSGDATAVGVMMAQAEHRHSAAVAAAQRRRLQQAPAAPGLPPLPPLPTAEEMAATRDAMGDVKVPGACVSSSG